MRIKFKTSLAEIHKVYLLRSALFILIALYTLAMFGIVSFSHIAQPQVLKSVYHMTGLRFFIMLVFFLPFVVLLSEMETYISKKLGINHDGNY